MYLVGEGHEHLGPGTSMVQRINWTPGQERQLENAGRGLGCGCRGMAGCPCSGGLGLFDTGLDLSGWSWPEYAIVIIGGYMVLSTLFTTKRAVSRVRAMPGERRKRRAAEYRAKAAELSKKR